MLTPASVQEVTLAIAAVKVMKSVNCIGGIVFGVLACSLAAGDGHAYPQTLQQKTYELAEARILIAVLQGRGDHSPFCLYPVLQSPEKEYRLFLTRKDILGWGAKYRVEAQQIANGGGTLLSDPRPINMNMISRVYSKARVVSEIDCERVIRVTRPIINPQAAFLEYSVADQCIFQVTRVSFKKRDAAWVVSEGEIVSALTGPPGCSNLPRPKDDRPSPQMFLITE